MEQREELIEKFNNELNNDNLNDKVIPSVLAAVNYIVEDIKKYTGISDGKEELFLQKLNNFKVILCTKIMEEISRNGKVELYGSNPTKSLPMTILDYALDEVDFNGLEPRFDVMKITVDKVSILDYWYEEKEVIFSNEEKEISSTLSK